MLIEGVDLSSMSFEDAARLVTRLLKVNIDTARQLVAADVGQSFDDVMKPGSFPPVVLRTNEE